MDWSTVFKVAMTVITSVGGMGAIIVGVVKWSANIIADKLSRKYQLQLDKDKERYKTDLSKKEFVSKTRFETEFKMYQELSEKNIAMVYCAGEAAVIARGAPYSDEEIGAFIQRYCDRLNEAKFTNTKYAPFIEEGIYDRYHLLEKEASEIFSLLKALKQYRRGESFSITIHEQMYHNKTEVEKTIIEKQKKLSDDSDSILHELRDYLSKLDVLED